MNLEEFRRHGHALIDWLADYHEGLASRPVQPPTRPGEVRAMLPAEPPQAAEKFEACIADLDTIVAPNLSHWQHPRFFGYFPANAMLAGVLRFQHSPDKVTNLLVALNRLLNRRCRECFLAEIINYRSRRNRDNVRRRLQCPGDSRLRHLPMHLPVTLQSS